MLRRRLQSPSTDTTWSDTELDSRLNLGLMELQKKILAINPDAVLKRFRRSVVAGVDRYQWPAGFSYDFELAILDSSASKYIPMDKGALHYVRRLQRDGYSSSYLYAHEGRSESRPYGGFVIVPTPTTTVANGFQVSAMCALTMDDDSSIPAVDQMMHLAILIYAEDVSLADTGEASDTAQKNVDRMIATLPQFMIRSAQPDQLSIDGVVKAYP
jgi:hypothetical protein